MLSDSLGPIIIRKVLICCSSRSKSLLGPCFEFYASSLPRLKRKIEGSNCDSAPSASSVPCNKVVTDVNQLLSIKYKKEKGTSETEK